MSAEIELVDRYSFLGPPSGCPGPCEGTGWVPVYCAFADMSRLSDERFPYKSERDPELRRRWLEADRRGPSRDGWHFVKCPLCGDRQ